ncbi:hypothetical protein [Niveibacterium sp. SC-1]|uniref:hypothetical protein n=1 Tax=Niveibacterium sp. SC-1 TaxID=3135646 RepID=UPI00311EE3AA
MYIVAIAWLFVAIMAAIGAHSIIGGIFTFLGFTLPLLLLLWLFGSPVRARRRKAQENASTSVVAGLGDATKPDAPSGDSSD